jgi:hypothetical protein
MNQSKTKTGIKMKPKLILCLALVLSGKMNEPV